MPTERGILNVGEEAHTAAAQAEGLLSPYSAPPASILEVPMGYTRIKLLPSDLLGGDGKEILVLEADMWKYEDGYDYEPPDDDYDLYSSTCSLFVDGDSGDIVEEPVTEGRLTQVNCQAHHLAIPVILKAIHSRNQMMRSLNMLRRTGIHHE